MRAQASAASHPAWPAPTTITSYTPRNTCIDGSTLSLYSWLICTLLFLYTLAGERLFLINDSYYCADHARRQYFWEECLHDWFYRHFVIIKTRFKVCNR